MVSHQALCFSEKLKATKQKMEELKRAYKRQLSDIVTTKTSMEACEWKIYCFASYARKKTELYSKTFTVDGVPFRLCLQFERKGYVGIHIEHRGAKGPAAVNIGGSWIALVMPSTQTLELAGVFAEGATLPRDSMMGFDKFVTVKRALKHFVGHGGFLTVQAHVAVNRGRPESRKRRRV